MSLIKTVGALARQVLAREEEERNKALDLYPKMLESNATDAKSVEQMQRVMELVGKTPADLITDNEILREFRRQQEVLAAGCGLSEKREAAIKAFEAHNAETRSIIEQRRAEAQRLQIEMNEYEQLHLNAQRAAVDLAKMRGAHAKLLRHEPKSFETT
jgi:hypothetical protein